MRYDFQGNRFVLHLDPAARSYVIDFTSDGQWNVTSACKFENGEVAFVDTAGEQRCPETKRRYICFLGEDLDRAIELDPGNAKAYVQRGHIKLELDKKFAACKDWEAAFGLGYPAAEKLMLNHCRYLLKDRHLKGRYPKGRSSQGTQPE